MNDFALERLRFAIEENTRAVNSARPQIWPMKLLKERYQGLTEGEIETLAVTHAGHIRGMRVLLKLIQVEHIDAALRHAGAAAIAANGNEPIPDRYLKPRPQGV
jgi:hypothetical protein